MKEELFKKLYKEFKLEFEISDYEDKIKYWEEYIEDLREEGEFPDEFPINKWIKQENKDIYLPTFLDQQEKLFGHASAGRATYTMIYKNSEGKFYNGYKKDVKWYVDQKEIEEDYKKYIARLIMDLIKADSLEKIYELEEREDYKKFSAKALLRKISVLMSILDKSSYKMSFAWIYSDERLKKLAEILDVEAKSDYTMLKLNNKIYTRAKELAGIDDEKSTLYEYIKLYHFLWFLVDESYNVEELSDINSPNIIFNGAPGTGKTYSVSKGICKLQAINGNLFKDSVYTQFHPSYTYQDFIEGIKPIGIKNGNLNLQVINGNFKDFCIKVKKENEKYWKNNHPIDVKNIKTYSNWPQYFFVVDEINRGNLSNIFGETFTLLEYRDFDFSGNYENQTSNLVSTALSNVIESIDNNDSMIYKKIKGKAYFGIPFNIRFIGIMNDVDRSIDPFDLALRRRFKWITKLCDYEIIERVLIENGLDKEHVSNYIESCKKLNDYICNNSGLGLGKNYEIGHAFFLKILSVLNKEKIAKDKKTILFDNFILGTLKEYIRQVTDESGVDDCVEKAKKEFGII